jgi:flap endonuclease-1
MGVDLGDLCAKHSISLESLSGKIVAVDAFNVLYQFLASIRQEDGTPLMDFNGNITAHLSGLFYRTSKLIKNGIKPVYVFDGVSHKFKQRTKEERAQIKRAAEEKWREALEEKRFKDAKMYAAATSRLTTEMVEESKSLLEGMGVPYIQAPTEGEAQAAQMVEKGLAYATASQDYDALLFGSPLLVRNLSITGRRKVPRQDRYIMIEPEEIKLKETVDSLGISREKMIWIGLLVGTDFNKGVKRVGPKTALKLVKEYDDLNELTKFVEEKYEHEFEVELDELVGFFMNPPYEEVKEKMIWGQVKKDKIIDMLVEKHDFAHERIEKTIDDIIHSFKEKGAQKKLEDWF